MIDIDKIYNEDCLSGMKRIPDKFVDCIICDLPYGVLNKGNVNAKWDCVIPFEPLWSEYGRIIKDNGAIVLFAQGMFTAELMMSNPKMWRYNLIWDKCRTTNPLNAKVAPLRCHEDIVVFYKNKPTYNPQMEELNGREKSHVQGRGVHKNTNQCYGEIDRKKGYVPKAEYEDKKFPRSIVSVKADHSTERFHPTQKPVALLEWIVKTYTNKNELVLDNCMGSGTTAVACINTERHFIGFETDEVYYEKSLKRIESLYEE